MREILFRGKTICKNEWYYGSYLFLHLPDYDWTCKASGKAEDVHYIENKDGINLAIIPETVCQYTGMEDNDGKEIFENDIIKDVSNGKGYSDEELEEMGIPKEHYTRFGKNHIFQIGVVVYRKGSFFIESLKDESKTWTSLSFSVENEFSYCTVIGNIFDNPELLSPSID